MLVQLSIRNIVLIESCDIALKSGLCVLSGETGAGKSILLDALGLALGARGEAGLVRRGEAQGSVSAEFDISHNEQAQSVLADLEIEASDTVIIRRSVAADGKTRCLVNDRPVTVAGLKRLGETLVEIHGQHDQRALQDAALHRALLDDYARLAGTRKAVEAAWQGLSESKAALEALQAQLQQSAREQEYLQHIRNELKELAPQAGEEEMLATQRTVMMQNEKLCDVLSAAIGELSQGKGVASALRSAQRLLTRSPLTSTEGFSSIVEGLEKAAIEAEEALYNLEKTGQSMTFDPAKLEHLEERLFALKAAGRKYNLPVDELSALYEQAQEKLSLVESQEQRVGELESRVVQARETFTQAAGRLSEMRRKAAGKLEKAIAAELSPLKMTGTRFSVRIDPLDESGWSRHGMDLVHFECATNVTKNAADVTYAPLSKIASGGELSRFMLALKVALSTTRSTPTLIFDEIDSGTGGAVAAAIGERLSLLGKGLQVLVVTHLPQVAARGNQHLLVAKQEKRGHALTSVAELAAEARQEELARMLAGAVVTPEARKAAQKLLEQAA